MDCRYGLQNKMSWGNSWGNDKWSNSFSGGNSYSENREPEGTHNASCISDSGGWGSTGWGRASYDENCSGCRHERARSSIGAYSQGQAVSLLVALIGGSGKNRKKSIWG